MRRRRRLLGWVLLLLLSVGGLLWLFHDEALDWFGTAIGEAPAAGEVSPELARHTEERLRAFAAGDGPDSVALGTPALQSLLRYRSDGLLPAGIRDPRIYLTDSTAVLGGTLQVRELASADAAERLQKLLGDTAAVRAEVVPAVTGPAVGRVRVRTLEAGGLTVPEFLIPTVLRQAELPVEDGRPRTVVFRIPQRLTGIAVRDSQLVLTRSAAGDGSR